MSKRNKSISMRAAHNSVFPHQPLYARTVPGASGWPITQQSDAILEYVKKHGPVTSQVVHMAVIAEKWPRWRHAQTAARMQTLAASRRLKRVPVGMFTHVENP